MLKIKSSKMNTKRAAARATERGAAGLRPSRRSRLAVPLSTLFLALAVVGPGCSSSSSAEPAAPGGRQRGEGRKPEVKKSSEGSNQKDLTKGRYSVTVEVGGKTYTLTSWGPHHNGLTVQEGTRPLGAIDIDKAGKGHGMSATANADLKLIEDIYRAWQKAGFPEQLLERRKADMAAAKETVRIVYEVTPRGTSATDLKIEDVLASGQYRQCIPAATAQDPKKSGAVGLIVKIEAGNVTDVSVDNKTAREHLPPSDFVVCVSDKIKNLQFPKDIDRKVTWKIALARELHL